MFACRSCTRRLLALLLENGFPADTRKLLTNRPAYRARSYATAATAVKESRAAGRSNPEDDSWNDPDKKRGVSKSMEWAVDKNLQYLKDPLFIAQHVERTLARGQFEEAALLVRKASKDYNVAVSWNHLIEHQLRNNKLHAALKLFQEMKKRAQLPTAQTYTIIFNGCAKSPHPKLAVSEAVRLYNNMLQSSDERLTPNTIHLNAVLNVCARADDIETMFVIVKSANRGIRAPNNTTYTTVINALRAHVNKPNVHERADPNVVEEATRQTIQRAQAIWEEVISKWRSAEVILDEELVCAMGRVLLMGDYRDSNAIFSLLEQTMSIPKDEQELLALAKGKDAPEEAEGEGKDDRRPNTKVLQTPRSNQRNQASPTHARPGKNSLSLVLAAAEKTRKTTLGPRYWTVYTKVYSVEPDSENWYSLMNVLRRGKNSGKTVEYLWKMPKQYMIPKTFRTAMGTCLADNLNKSAFNNATQVIEVMLTSLRMPDLQVMRTYIRVAYANKRMFEHQAKKDIVGAKLAWGKQLTTTLDNLWEPYKIASKQFAFGGLGAVPEKRFVEDSEREEWLRDALPRMELAALARKMIAAYDRLLNENMVPEDVAAKLKPRRNSLNHFVVKYFEQREKYEPGWRNKIWEIERKEEKEAREDENTFARGPGNNGW